MKTALMVIALLMLAHNVGARQSFAGELPGIKTDAGCGEAVNGLQLCVLKISTKLRLEFRNLGATPLRLDMGFKLGNGEEHSSVRLTVRVGNKTHNLEDTFSIHGRIYPWVVTLPAAATYSTAIDLNRHVPRFQTPYWFSAEYTQHRVEGDPEYWSGTARSGEWWVD